MPRISAVAIAAALLVWIGSSLAPGPAAASDVPGDDYPGITIESIPFSDSVNTEAATTEPGEPVGSCIFGAPPEATIWYNYTPSEDLTLRADTLGSDYDTVIAVWTISAFPGAPLAEVACSDDFTFEGDSGQAFKAEAGRTYYIQAGGYPFTTPTGNLTVNLTEIFAAPNDDFGDATNIPSLPFSDSVDTGASSVEISEPTPICAFGLLDSTVWYAFTPQEDGAFLVDTSGSTFDSVAAVYTQTQAGLAEVACNDNGSFFSLAARLGFAGESGTTYYIQVGGNQGFGPSSGALDFRLDVLDVPDCVLTDNLFTDPLGDDFSLLLGSFDVTGVRSGADDDNLCLRIEFADDLSGSAEPANLLGAAIAIDTDSNPATGGESTTDFYCEAPSGIGEDAEVAVLGGNMIAPILTDIFPFGASPFPEFLDRYGVAVFDGNAVNVILPLDTVGGDDTMNTAIVVGNSFGVTDCVPDAGHISLPIGARIQGDIDCDGDSDAVDAQKLLSYIAGLPLNLAAGCTSPGTQFGPFAIGDIDCDGDVDSVDVLAILRRIAGLSVQQQQPCQAIGQPLAASPTY